MGFLKLICTNLYRHRIRSLIGIAGIAFGVAAMLTVLSIVLGAVQMFERILSSDSHYLVFEKNVSDLFFSSVSDAQAESMAGMDNVESARPILFGIVSSENNPVVTCFGVTAGDSRLQHARWIQGKPEDFGKEPKTVYLGSRAAEFMQASMGQSVLIGKNSYRVGGIISTENGFEDGGVFLPLDEAQHFFHREGFASIVSVKLQDTDKKAEFKEALEERYPDLIALENSEFSQSYSQFKILSATAWSVGICAFLLGGMGVANTLLMSVFGRIREIAILRVCGFSRGQIAGLIFGEAIVLSFVGIIAGLLAGVAILEILKLVPQFNGYITTITRPDIFIWITLVAVLTSLAGALYPASYAVRIQPADALRYE